MTWNKIKMYFCVECNTEFKPRNAHHKYCSAECGKKVWSQLYTSPVPKGEMFQDSVKKKWDIGKELTCPECNKKFLKKYVSHKYCNKECRGIYNKKIIDARYEEKRKQKEIENKYYGQPS